MADIGPDVALQESAESGEGRYAPKVAVTHLEWDEPNPSDATMDIQLKFAGNERTHDLDRDWPVDKGNVRPSHLDCGGSGRKFWTSGHWGLREGACGR